MSGLFDEPWAIAEDALVDFVARVDSTVIEAAAFDAFAPTAGTFERDGRTAVIEVNGPIASRPNIFTMIFGMQSHVELAESIAAADADGGVDAIRLEMDTPGGAVSGIDGVIAALDAASKPVETFVAGMCCSAGVWIASATDTITVTPTSIVGSLGVVMTTEARRNTRVREFVSSQTPGKRSDPNTEEGQGAIQSVVDRLADEFLGDVAERRGVSVDALLESTGGGGVLVGSDAEAAGLADSVRRIPEADIAAAAQRRNEREQPGADPERGGPMAVDTPPDQPALIPDALIAGGQAEEETAMEAKDEQIMSLQAKLAETEAALKQVLATDTAASAERSTEFAALGSQFKAQGVELAALKVRLEAAESARILAEDTAEVRAFIGDGRIKPADSEALLGALAQRRAGNPGWFDHAFAGLKPGASVPLETRGHAHGNKISEDPEVALHAALVAQATAAAGSGSGEAFDAAYHAAYKAHRAAIVRH